MGRLSGNIPGSVLKTITEEHKCLGQFVDLLKQRIDLDRKYLDDLGWLFQSVDPAWSQTAIWPLVEPFLDNISNEVASRRETCEIVDTRIKALPKVNSPDLSSDSGLPMTKEYEELGKAFQEHERCRTEASSLSSIAELKVWHGSEYDHSIFSDLTTSDVQSFRLPQSNRLYRQSVLRQQQKSIKMSVWHSSVLPNRLEDHQQQSEDIKKAITKILNSQSDLHVKLVSGISLAKDRIQKFSSSAFISEAYEHQQLEAGHLWMQPVNYMDFETGESSETVIFGTDRGIEIMSVLLKMFDGNISWARVDIRSFPKKKEMIRLEQQFRVSGAVSETLGLLGDEQHDKLFWFIGLSQPPLVDIEGDEIKRYLKNSIPRDKIQSIMERVVHRRLTGDLIRSFRAHGYLQKFCPLLTHHISDEVERIMWGIADKWDFENHCPLPKGVVRSYMNGKTWTFWEKSRELYEPSRKDPNRPISPGST